ncbi:MAG: four helix bundle protein [Bacteroidetes bacterium]|nr:four helix bundle protein [Bacteroidota bacterium]MBL6943289.1 four helix bundle protein [Bacteroidales bacterium]
MRNDKPNIIVELTFKFALKIISFSEKLSSNGKTVVANQLLKSGTSIGANVREAQNAESKADFIHKLKIAAKEVDETIYWLDLAKYSDGYPYDEELSEQISVIEKVISKIISTTKKSKS